MRLWLCWWVGLLAVWGLLVATVDPLEWALGAIVAAVAATAAEVARVRGLGGFQLDPRWLRGVWEFPWYSLRDTVLIFRVLWRRVVRREPVTGSFRTVDWPASTSAARDSARRALVVAGLSLTANTYVVDVDGGRGTVLLHQLAADERPPIPSSLLEGP